MDEKEELNFANNNSSENIDSLENEFITAALNSLKDIETKIDVLSVSSDKKNIYSIFKIFHSISGLSELLEFGIINL